MYYERNDVGSLSQIVINEEWNPVAHDFTLTNESSIHSKDFTNTWLPSRLSHHFFLFELLFFEAWSFEGVGESRREARVLSELEGAAGKPRIFRKPERAAEKPYIANSFVSQIAATYMCF